ncbi:MAG: hypothetical protein IPN43_06245 [Chitinophagaceae bacterium]|nr:hypothetical protein [Chitinophagaceae bacterium]
MVRQIYIPQEVKDDIRKHLDTSINKAVNGFPSSYEDEDVVTGHLFGLMKSDEQSVVVKNQEVNGEWKWSIDFKKFGGRGKAATESIIGADGIIELHLTQNNETVSKSLLFQSKLDWDKKDKKLYEQCAKLLTWLGAAVVINYTQEKYEAYSLDQVFSSQGSKPSRAKLLQTMLGADFIDCTIGDSDLFYDAVKKSLTWLNNDNMYVSTKFNLNRRLKINIKAPNRNSFYKIKAEKEIP